MTFRSLALALLALLAPGALRPAAAADAPAPAQVGLALVSQAGSKADLDVSLADGADAPIASGRVKVLDGRRTLLSARTDATGRVRRRVTLRPGDRTLVARWAGSAAAGAADSPPLVVTIARPAAVSPRNRAAVDTTRPQLSWTAVTGATGYRVRLTRAGAPPAEVTSATTSASAPKLARGAVYRWTVVALLPAGTSLPSATRTFSVRRDAGSGWRFDVVASEGAVGAYPRIAVDSAGRPRISYLDYETDTFRLALWDGAAWTDELIGAARGPYVLGKRSVIAIDASDRVHACWTLPDVAVRYARRDADGTWTGTTSIAGGIPYAFLGGYSAITVNRATGVPTVLGRVYGLVSVQDTSVASWTPGAGAFQHVEGTTADRAGGYVSAATGADGVTRGAWQLTDDVLTSGSHLRFGRANLPGWGPATVVSDMPESTSSGNSWEALSSLALDSADRPRIAWLAGNGDYRLAVHDGTSWSFSTIAPVSSARERAHVSLAVGPGNVDHVAFLGAAARLGYARRDGGTWSVDAAVDTVGEECSIAVDADGGVHIAYYDDVRQDLRYAYLAP